MKRLNPPTLVKFSLILLILGSMVISAKIIYHSLTKAMRVNPLLVESYKPHLDTDLVKKAATALQEKSQP